MDVARKQIEYYFSPKNLAKDTQLDQELKDNNNVCRYAWLIKCPKLHGMSIEDVKEVCRAWSPSSCTDEGIVVPSRGLKRPREYLEVVLSSSHNDEAPPGAFYYGDGFYVGFPTEGATSVFGRDKWKYLDACPRWVKQAFKDEEIRKRQRRPSVLLDQVAKEAKARKNAKPKREETNTEARQQAVVPDRQPAEARAPYASTAAIGKDNTMLQERACVFAEKSTSGILEPLCVDEPVIERATTVTGAPEATDNNATVGTPLKPRVEPPDTECDTCILSQEQTTAAISVAERQADADGDTKSSSWGNAVEKVIAFQPGSEQPLPDDDTDKTSLEQVVATTLVREGQPLPDDGTDKTSQKHVAATILVREGQPLPDDDMDKTSQEHVAATILVREGQPLRDDDTDKTSQEQVAATTLVREGQHLPDDHTDETSQTHVATTTLVREGQPLPEDDMDKTSQEQVAATTLVREGQPLPDDDTNETSQGQVAATILVREGQPLPDDDTDKTSQEQVAATTLVREGQPLPDDDMDKTSQEQVAATIPVREGQPLPDDDTDETSQEQVAVEKNAVSEQPASGSSNQAETCKESEVAFQAAEPDGAKVPCCADAMTDDASLEEPLRHEPMDLETPLHGDASEEPSRHELMDVEAPMEMYGDVDMECREAPNASDARAVVVKPKEKIANKDFRRTFEEPIHDSRTECEDRGALRQLIEDTPKEGESGIPVELIAQPCNKKVAPLQLKEDAPQDSESGISVEPRAQPCNEVGAPVQLK